jgi:hypothetical protein
MSMSIDGFVADPDSGLKWIFDKDEEAAAWTVETVWYARRFATFRREGR